MKTKIDIRKALQGKLAPQRHRAYKHRPGRFLLTADFRDPNIDMARVEMVAALVKVYTQRNIAVMLGCSTTIVGKCVRIHAALQK